MSALPGVAQAQQAGEASAQGGKALGKGPGASPPGEGRPGFNYIDGATTGGRIYRRPDVNIDPTDLTIEELKSRLTRVEERLELIERALAAGSADHPAIPPALRTPEPAP